MTGCRRLSRSRICGQARLGVQAPQLEPRQARPAGRRRQIARRPLAGGRQPSRRQQPDAPQRRHRPRAARLHRRVLGCRLRRSSPQLGLTRLAPAMAGPVASPSAASPPATMADTLAAIRANGSRSNGLRSNGTKQQSTGFAIDGIELPTARRARKHRPQHTSPTTWPHSDERPGTGAGTSSDLGLYSPKTHTVG